MEHAVNEQMKEREKEKNMAMSKERELLKKITEQANDIKNLKDTIAELQLDI